MNTKYNVGDTTCFGVITGITVSKDKTTKYNGGNKHYTEQELDNALVAGADISKGEAVKIVGNEVLPCEDKPKPEPKPEPVKLFCVKGYEPGVWLTRGKVYEVTDGDTPAQQTMPYDKYDREWGRWEDRTLNGTKLTDLLVPLVSRPAKFGEWVVVTSSCISNTYSPNSKGKLMLVERVEWDGRIYDKAGYTMHDTGYLVLDGYDGRYEEEKPQKMTVAEIAKALGHSVEVVEG